MPSRATHGVYGVAVAMSAQCSAVVKTPNPHLRSRSSWERKERREKHPQQWLVWFERCCATRSSGSPERGQCQLDEVQGRLQTWGCSVQNKGMKEACEIINWRCLCLFWESLNEAGRAGFKCHTMVSQPSYSQDVADAYGLDGLKKATECIYGRKRWEVVRKFPG